MHIYLFKPGSAESFTSPASRSRLGYFECDTDQLLQLVPGRVNLLRGDWVQTNLSLAYPQPGNLYLAQFALDKEDAWYLTTIVLAQPSEQGWSAVLSINPEPIHNSDTAPLK
jgi:hypothetical protein